MFKSLLFLFLLSTSVYSQVDCPLNTPEFPFKTDSWPYYSWSANLYTPSQIGAAQTMTSISFRLDNDASGGWNTYTYTNCKIWVRNSSVIDYDGSLGYPGTAGFTEIYSGDFTFSGPGVYVFNFNVAPSFNYDGASTFEVLFESRGGSDNTWDEPWFDRTNARTDGVNPGRVGWGSSWLSATTSPSQTSNRLYNLQINNTTCNVYPLPVSLSESSLDCYDNFVVLNWVTISEINNDFFLIESSIDGIEWKEETRVNGQGSSQEKINYTVKILKNRRNEATYYRLSQTDFDGTRENLVSHSSDCVQKEIEVYPNPFSNEIRILNFKGAVENIELINQLGQKQDVSFIFKNHQVVLLTEKLATGIYFVVLDDGTVYRLIKQ